MIVYETVLWMKLPSTELLQQIFDVAIEYFQTEYIINLADNIFVRQYISSTEELLERRRHNGDAYFGDFRTN
jgi:hypothetical protein